MVNSGGNVVRKRIIVNDGARIGRAKSGMSVRNEGGDAIVSNRGIDENLTESGITDVRKTATRALKAVIDNDGARINRSKNVIQVAHAGGKAVILNRDAETNGAENRIEVAADVTGAHRALIDNRRADVNDTVNTIVD